MRKPAELNDAELAMLANKVRSAVINTFGYKRFMKVLKSDPEIIESLAKETYKAVRAYLEE